MWRGAEERPVKPSAQPTLVRTQHLPPPAKTARSLRKRGPAGRFPLVPPCVIVCRCRSSRSDRYGHIADSVRAEGAVRGTACFADLRLGTNVEHRHPCAVRRRRVDAPGELLQRPRVIDQRLPLGVLGHLAPGQHRELAVQAAHEQVEGREDHSGMISPGRLHHPGHRVAEPRALSRERAGHDPNRISEPHRSCGPTPGITTGTGRTSPGISGRPIMTRWSSCRWPRRYSAGRCSAA